MVNGWPKLLSGGSVYRFSLKRNRCKSEGINVAYIHSNQRQNLEQFKILGKLVFNLKFRRKLPELLHTKGLRVLISHAHSLQAVSASVG